MITQVLRVIIAEDDALLRQGVVHLLERVDDIEVVGEAGDLPGLRSRVEELTPDVVVTDIRMPPTGSDEGIQAAGWIAAQNPEVGVVVLSQYVNPEYALALLAGQCRRRAYLLKERVADVAELTAAIRKVADGGSVLDPAVVDALLSAHRTKPVSPLGHLTSREAEVLARMAQGKSNAAVAADMHLSERAVEKHSTSIFMKLGLSEERDLNRRVSAVLIFLGEGSHIP